MSKKDAKAIDALKSLLNELVRITDVQSGNNWKSKLKDTLNLYLGENSSLTKRAEDIYFTTLIIEPGFPKIHVFNEDNKDNFRDLINNAVNYIQTNGVFIPNNKSGYFTVKHEVFWPIAISLIAILCGAAFTLGGNRFDQKMIDLSDANKTLSDTIRVRNNSIIYLKANSDSALKVISNMPYDQMTLLHEDKATIQFTIETAGAVLSLNK